MTGTSRQRRVAVARTAARIVAPEPFFVINSDPSETNPSTFTLIIHAVRCSSESLSTRERHFAPDHLKANAALRIFTWFTVRGTERGGFTFLPVRSSF